MASPSAQKPCAKCPKGISIITCHGCEQSFCLKHLNEHRQDLSMQMEHIGQDHDLILHDLMDENWLPPSILKINQWEEEAIKKIKETAEIARTNARQEFNQIKNKIKLSIEQIAKELQMFKESEAYTEIDLNRCSSKLSDIRKLLERPLTLRIEEDNSIAIATGLRTNLEQKQLSEKKRLGSTQEIFNKAMDAVCLFEEGLVATYTGELNYYKTIFGKNVYGSDVNHIHFQIENKNTDNFFFGIVTSTQSITSRIFDAPSANGWWGFDVPVMNGSSQKRCGKDILQNGDVITLTLDCQFKRIQLINYRTKTILQLAVDIKKCPHPWKVVITLARPNDSIRIL